METGISATRDGARIDLRRGGPVADNTFRGRRKMKFSKESFERIKWEIGYAHDLMADGTPEDFSFLSVELCMNFVLREIENTRRASEK
jgi:hypothetical protein